MPWYKPWRISKSCRKHKSQKLKSSGGKKNGKTYRKK